MFRAVYHGTSLIFVLVFGRKSSRNYETSRGLLVAMDRQRSCGEGVAHTVKTLKFVHPLAPGKSMNNTGFSFFARFDGMAAQSHRTYAYCLESPLYLCIQGCAYTVILIGDCISEICVQNLHSSSK